MRIVRSTPDEIVVKNAPWFLAGTIGLFAASMPVAAFITRDQIDVLAVWAIAVTSALIALAGIAVARWTTVTMSKATGRIEFNTAALIGAGRRVVSFKHFIAARADVCSDAEGKASRLLFVFDDAMASELDPSECAAMERLRSRGFRRAKVTEIPLTVYYSGGDEAERLADQINAWAREK
jgi:hypothetical protein